MIGNTDFRLLIALQIKFLKTHENNKLHTSNKNLRSEKSG
jgi:hypothetical protein